MRPILIIILMGFLIMATITVYPALSEAQFFELDLLWRFQPFPLPPYLPPWGGGPIFGFPFSGYTRGYYVLPLLPIPSSMPLLVEPSLRIANAPLTLAIPTNLTTTSPPLTAILNLLDTGLLASNIAILNNNFPAVFNALVTTFNLPL